MVRVSRPRPATPPTLTPEQVRLILDACASWDPAAREWRGSVRDRLLWALLAESGMRLGEASGGLLAKGHPIGATGVAQITECWWQLRGEANERQIETRSGFALQHNAGGRGSGVSVVNILTNRD